MANFPKYHTILILIAIFIIKTSRSDVTSLQDLFDTIKNQTQSGRAPVNVPSLQFIDTFYGCHCRNFDQGKILADVRLATKGTPVDPVDEICQYLHNGWSCLATRDNCDIQAPYITPSLINFVPNASDIPMQECERVNPSQCGQNLCKVEMYFVINLFNYMFTNIYDQNMTDDNGFDVGMDCPLFAGSCSQVNKCCVGEYPTKDIEFVCSPSICPN